VSGHLLIVRFKTHEFLITIKMNPVMVLGTEVSGPGLASSGDSEEPEDLVMIILCGLSLRFFDNLCFLEYFYRYLFYLLFSLFSRFNTTCSLLFLLVLLELHVCFKSIY